MKKKITTYLLGATFAVLSTSLMYQSCNGSKPGTIQDEAMQVGRDAGSLAGAKDDYFADMDGGVKLSEAAIQGRNTWNVWTAGNDQFWDILSRRSVGTVDFLKTISSYDPAKDPKAPQDKIEGLKKTYRYGRNNRFRYLGLINEPCFEQATGPDEKHKGLWLDKLKGGCKADPYSDDQKYPGLKIGARGKNMPLGSYYGEQTGILGLRLFPNPAFDEAAEKKWDPVRYYTDPSYYNDKDLIKPYRVGMSCGFCHIGPDPERPPADPENPEFKNLSSYVGAQYFWVDRIFAWDGDRSSFPYQLFHTSRPGTLDTSFISTDSINNPRTMNAVYSLLPRLEQGLKFGRETLAGGELDNKQFNDYFPDPNALNKFFVKPDKVFTPHVLKDGADSVGALGALNRVFLNIGLFGEDWITHFNPLVGGKPTTPMAIANNRKNSSFWLATESQTPGVAAFFLEAAKPHKLETAAGPKYKSIVDSSKLALGKKVFAQTCARCHSSKLPELPAGVNPGADECMGANYLACFDKYWKHTKTPEFKAAMVKIVEQPDFLKDNFLSTDLRVPVTLLKTNACSPLAANGLEGNIWDNFTSHTYKSLPSVGEVEIVDPFTGAKKMFKMPAGGRGYTRPASLISVWSTAPYLLNNSVGSLYKGENPYEREGYNPNPNVESRLEAFQDGIEQMLWPEKRVKDSVLKDVGLIDRTQEQTWVNLPFGFLPDHLQGIASLAARLFPKFFGSDGVKLGPIPKGTPIALLSNLQLLTESKNVADQAKHKADILELVRKIKNDLIQMDRGASNDAAKAAFANVKDQMFAMSNCPDYVVNKGHYFGTDQLASEEPALSDAEKRALIEYLKTF